jgi:hypothetical protein
MWPMIAFSYSATHQCVTRAVTVILKVIERPVVMMTTHLQVGLESAPETLLLPDVSWTMSSVLHNI